MKTHWNSYLDLEVLEFDCVWGFFVCLGEFKVEGEKDGIRSAEILSLLETEVKE